MMKEDFIEIYQDFVYPEKEDYPYPKTILHGFKKFCVEQSIDFELYF